ncbi:amidohydrolase [Parafilimonas sp.]|uniref:amidohydrolase n=1 Tax=Parafilimonas sp. TaxID=1969739 RepID=UPI0039E55069
MQTLTCTLIQSKLYWQDAAANRQMFAEKINAIQQKTEVVILPEMFSTGFSMQPEKFAETMDGDTVAWMKKTAASKKIIIVGSLMIKAPSLLERAQGEAFYNRLIWMLPNGDYGYYDKRHLFAYGDEHKHYTAGNKRLIASVKGWKINLQVCYDLRFPVWARQSLPLHLWSGTGGEGEYDVLIYVANWPERRAAAWKTLLQARAIENQCYVIGVNRIGDDGNGIYHSGDSMVIDPLGEILYHKKDEEDIFTVELNKKHLESVRTKLPFLKDADRFIITNE